MNLNHLQACGHCPKYDHGDGTTKTHTGCSIYADVTWVNRIGGCPVFPYRAVPKSRGEYVDGVIISGKRVGQQHQKRLDRKYENRKSKRKYR